MGMSKASPHKANGECAWFWSKDACLAAVFYSCMHTNTSWEKWPWNKHQKNAYYVFFKTSPRIIFSTYLLRTPDEHQQTRWRWSFSSLLAYLASLKKKFHVCTGGRDEDDVPQTDASNIRINGSVLTMTMDALERNAKSRFVFACVWYVGLYMVMYADMRMRMCE